MIEAIAIETLTQKAKEIASVFDDTAPAENPKVKELRSQIITLESMSVPRRARGHRHQLIDIDCRPATGAGQHQAPAEWRDPLDYTDDILRGIDAIRGRALHPRAAERAQENLATIGIREQPPARQDRSALLGQRQAACRPIDRTKIGLEGGKSGAAAKPDQTARIRPGRQGG